MKPIGREEKVTQKDRGKMQNRRGRRQRRNEVGKSLKGRSENVIGWQTHVLSPVDNPLEHPNPKF